MKTTTIATLFLSFIGSTEILKAQFAQIPGAGLETWSPVTYMSTTFEDPQDWGTTNFDEALLGNPIHISKTTDKRSGAYAMKLQSSADIAVMAVAGASPISYNLGDGFAFSQRPAYLQFYYKFTFGGKDTADISVVFTKNNGGEVVGVGDEQIFTTQSGTYTIFNVPIYYLTGNNPDHAVIWITMGNDVNPSNNNGNSILYVDDFTFTNTNVTGVASVSEAEEQLSVYPNPSVNGIFNVHFNSQPGKNSLLTVRDINGKIVYSENSEQLGAMSDKTIDLSNEQAGVYFVQVAGEDWVVNKKVVIQ